jgi:hypothetical protein
MVFIALGRRLATAMAVLWILEYHEVANKISCPEISAFRRRLALAAFIVSGCYHGPSVFDFILPLIAAVRAFFRSRADVALEILALRQQVVVLKHKTTAAAEP